MILQQGTAPVNKKEAHQLVRLSAFEKGFSA
jgi:hypothetical protein